MTSASKDTTMGDSLGFLGAEGMAPYSVGRISGGTGEVCRNTPAASTALASGTTPSRKLLTILPLTARCVVRGINKTVGAEPPTIKAAESEGVFMFHFATR